MPRTRRNWSNAGLPGQSSLYSVSDVAPTQLILERQQADVNIICALDLVWQLAPPDLLPLGVVRPSELKGHGDASVHGFIQVMGPAHTLLMFRYMGLVCVWGIVTVICRYMWPSLGGQQ